jgi:hypothetical protein
MAGNVPGRKLHTMSMALRLSDLAMIGAGHFQEKA